MGQSLTAQADLVESLVRRIRFLDDQERTLLEATAANLRDLDRIHGLVAHEEVISDAATDEAANHLVEILLRS